MKNFSSSGIKCNFQTSKLPNFQTSKLPNFQTSKLCNRLLNLLLILFMNYSVQAQQQSECTSVLIDSSSSAVAVNNPPCLNVDSIFENCIPVYIKVNFHFFVNQDCKGTVTVPGYGTQATQSEAAGWASYMIWEANNVLANNQPQLNAAGPGTSSSASHCNPIRWVLKGVYFHCANEKNNGYELSSLLSTYGKNINSELNIFLALPIEVTNQGPLIHGGVAFLRGTVSSIRALDWGLMNHELAHNLGNGHSFDGTRNCLDAPKLEFDWDENCDGIISNSEKQRRCWIKTPPSDPICNLAPTCPNFPCCLDDFIDNNVVGNNPQRNAWTNCQIKSAIEHIADYKCEFIQQVGGNCPPASSVVTRSPIEDTKESHCSYCFEIDGSSNYDQYKIEIYNNSNPTNPILLKTVGWLSRGAKRFCIGGTNLSNTWQDGMLPGVPYLIKLIVKNDCGEDVNSYPFILPNRTCSVSGPSSDKKFELRVSPNPAFNNAVIHYELDNSYETKVMVSHPLFSSFNYVASPLQIQELGNYDISIPVSSFFLA